MDNQCPHCRRVSYHDPRCVVYLADRAGALAINGRNSSADPAPIALPASPDPLFVAVKKTVMQAGDFIAIACSSTMARRIARALNEHKTNSRGI